MTADKSTASRIAPWRFLLFFVLFGVAGALLWPLVGLSKALLGGFDIAALVFLATCIPTFRDDAARLRDVAALNDANRVMLLVLSGLISLVILSAIMVELSQRDALGIGDKLLVAASLVIVWTFANAVYTLHYCHLFYSKGKGGRDCGGLDFPGTKEPRMSDFAYFAFTLGVAVQTSDVDISERHMRVVATWHSVAGFFFNLGVLALTINVLGN